MSRYQFPVLLFDSDLRRHPECPRAIPWEVLAPHAGLAEAEYGAQLKDLAWNRYGRSQSGLLLSGLDPIELCCLMDGRPWGITPGVPYQQEYAACVDRLRRVVACGRAVA